MTSLSPTSCIFRRNAWHGGGPLPSPPTLARGMMVCGSGVRHWVFVGSGQVISLSNDLETTEATAGPSRAGSVVLLGS